MKLYDKLREELGLTPALANHLISLLKEDYVELPRMEVYRLRLALRGNNTVILSKYGEGYYLLPEDKLAYKEWFKIS